MCFLSRDRVVGKREVHEVIKLGVRRIAEFPVPDIKPVAGAGSREVDVHVLFQHFAVRRNQRVGQTVQLGHLFERAQQREADDIEQGDGAVRDIRHAESLHEPIDDAPFGNLIRSAGGAMAGIPARR